MSDRLVQAPDARADVNTNWDGLVSEDLKNLTSVAKVPTQRDRRASPGPSPVIPSAPVPQMMQAWRATYSRVLLFGDLVVLATVMLLAQVLRFGYGHEAVAHLLVPVDYTTIGLIIAGGWWTSLQIYRTRAVNIFGNGTEEYRRVIRATFSTFGVVAMASLMLKLDASRGYLGFAFPLGLVGLIAWRKLLRTVLHRRRRVGRAMTRVLVVGAPKEAQAVMAALASHPSNGFRVTGVWSPEPVSPQEAQWMSTRSSYVPVFDSSRGLADVLQLSDAEAVMVTDASPLGRDGLGELAWTLDERGIELMVSPNVLDVPPSRLYMHDVSGMSLVHVDPPRYAGATRFAKSFFDRVGASAILLAASPFLIITALLVKFTSPGPVFYRQERIGQDGHPFWMIKFRSMRVGADAQLEALLAAQGKTLAELPKLTEDPRVTRVGAFIRRYSIDELPQLFNVLKGDMSLVGPRPQRDFEVEQYDHIAHRRLTVRPGMTGLWQVSGRSDIEFADAIRLDVHYVENWSMTGDLVILWKTISAVVGSDGAY